ncbi:hypothetical protein PO909_027538 [Leuciscus waleckii]
MKSGFYSPYFIVPKAAIDLKDAYFHVSILPRHRPFLRFAFEGQAYQYAVFPFGLALSPHIFTKVVEAALVPLREHGVRILNNLVDWLILAHSRDQVCEHRDLVLRHQARLGLRVNWEKSKLCPVQRISFLVMEIDSVAMCAQLTSERAQSLLTCLRQFEGKSAVPVKLFQRLLGHMASAAAVTLLGLFHMRPLQLWLRDRVLRWAWQHGTLRVPGPIAPRTSTPRDSISLAYSSEEGPAFSGTGHPVAPSSRSLEPPRVAPGRDEVGLSTLPPAVVATITSARALSTRHAYAFKWNLFVNWCSSKQQEPKKCPICVVLSFLQEWLERRLSPSTLKVYVAAIAAHHNAVDGKSLGKHDLIIRFLRGARRLNSPRPPLVPSWDLSVVLTALQSAPFEPLQSVELKFLSMKTALLVALASIKRVGDLQAFSVDEVCLEFRPANSHVILRPRPGYVPKVPTTPFRDQVVNLQALPLEEADPALALLCPVRALRAYVDRTQCFRTSDQLFVCHGGKLKGKALSKQRLSHWIVDAIALAYQQQGRPCPLGVTAHSTRSVASSWAQAHGAAGWATPNTFARFYNLRVGPVSSHVLASTSR